MTIAHTAGSTVQYAQPVGPGNEAKALYLVINGRATGTVTLKAKPYKSTREHLAFTDNTVDLTTANVIRLPDFPVESIEVADGGTGANLALEFYRY